MVPLCGTRSQSPVRSATEPVRSAARTGDECRQFEVHGQDLLHHHRRLVRQARLNDGGAGVRLPGSKAAERPCRLLRLTGCVGGGWLLRLRARSLLVRWRAGRGQAARRRCERAARRCSSAMRGVLAADRACRKRSPSAARRRRRRGGGQQPPTGHARKATHRTAPGCDSKCGQAVQRARGVVAPPWQPLPRDAPGPADARRGTSSTRDVRCGRDAALRDARARAAAFACRLAIALLLCAPGRDGRCC